LFALNVRFLAESGLLALENLGRICLNVATSLNKSAFDNGEKSKASAPVAAKGPPSSSPHLVKPKPIRAVSRSKKPTPEMATLP